MTTAQIGDPRVQDYLKILEGIRDNDLEKIRTICQRNPKLINVPGGERKANPFHRAIVTGNQAVVELLLGYNPNMDTKTGNGHTPMHLACGGGYYDMVALFLQRGARTDVRDYRGVYPIHIAIRYGFERIVNLLISHRASIQVRDDEGTTCLHYAVQSRIPKVAMIRTLLESGLDPNAANDKGHRPIHMAISKLSVDILTEFGARPLAENEERAPYLVAPFSQNLPHVAPTPEFERHLQKQRAAATPRQTPAHTPPPEANRKTPTPPLSAASQSTTGTPGSKRVPPPPPYPPPPHLLSNGSAGSTKVQRAPVTQDQLLREQARELEEQTRQQDLQIASMRKKLNAQVSQIEHLQRLNQLKPFENGEGEIKQLKKQMGNLSVRSNGDLDNDVTSPQIAFAAMSAEEERPSNPHDDRSGRGHITRTNTSGGNVQCPQLAAPTAGHELSLGELSGLGPTPHNVHELRS